MESNNQFQKISLSHDHSSRKTFKNLLGRMTLEEKIAQLGSIPIDNLIEKGRFSSEKAKEVLVNGIGQITRIAGGSDLEPKQVAETANMLQRFLIESTRLGIPAIVHEECLSGFMAKGGTAFPQAIGLASTWQSELIERMASAIREEMRAVGAHQGLSPVLDVVRDPRWGRVEETFGEDPYLVASIGVAYVKGLQGNDLKKSIIATLKHFAGHGFSEGGRNCAPVHLGPRELREVFLFPFEAAVKEANAESVMNAYHDIDGVPCAASRGLLTKILREEWGFKGIVVADYEAIDMLRNFHHTASDKKEAARQALKAGIDIELPKINCYGKPLLQAAKKRLISQEIIDQAVIRVLRTKMILGLFENPYVDPKQSSSILDKAEHRHLALEIARKSIILLKNEKNLLPLRKDIKSLVIIGPNALIKRNLLGDYSYMAHFSDKSDAIRIVNILDGIKNKVSKATRVSYAEGCGISEISTRGFAKAVKAAKNSEVAIVVVGGKSGLSPSDTCGEGRDRTDLGLPGVQEELVKAIYDTSIPVVVVLVNGRPFSMDWITNHIPAIVETYVFTKTKPLFPFGHGLSYTRFEYSELRITPKEIRPRGNIIISFKIKNIGNYYGDEVIQLYLHDMVASLTRPVKELKGFKRISLEAGEKKKVNFKLFIEQLAFYDRDINLVVEPGMFEVMIGSSSEDIRLRGQFEVVGEKKRIISPKIFFSEAF